MAQVRQSLNRSSFLFAVRDKGRLIREENDIDEELGKTLYDRIEGLEQRRLQTALKYNLDHGQNTSTIETRLKELQKK